MLILGHGLFGRCDFVPGRFHVATRFFTAFFVPLVPLEGYVVLGETGAHFQGVKIPISVKSLALAWGRAGLWAPGVVMALAGLYSVYCWLAGEAVDRGELLTFLGGGTLMIAAAVGSMFLGLRAPYERAVQLGMVAGVTPAVIAAEYGRAPLEGPQLEDLLRKIRPTTQEGRAALGPVGRFVGFVFMASMGAALTLWGATSFLNGAAVSWTAALWLPVAAGGACLLQAAAATLVGRPGWNPSGRALGIAILAVVMIGASGPWLSRWWWQSEIDGEWRAYLNDVSKYVEQDAEYPYSMYADAPSALFPTEYFLVCLLAEGKPDFNFRSPATLAWHEGDPHWSEVNALADAIERDAAKEGAAGWAWRRAQLVKILPQVQAGEWPANFRN